MQADRPCKIEVSTPHRVQFERYASGQSFALDFIDSCMNDVKMGTHSGLFTGDPKIYRSLLHPSSHPAQRS